MNRLRKWLSKPPSFHWYRVSFIYKTKQGYDVFSWTTDLGVKHQSQIMKHRALKQYAANVYEQSPELKHLFCNGIVALEPVCYLGYFSREPSEAEKAVEELSAFPRTVCNMFESLYN